MGENWTLLYYRGYVGGILGLGHRVWGHATG